MGLLFYSYVNVSVNGDLWRLHFEWQ